jgi:hypothetical protein
MGLDVDPAEAHAWGWEEIARLRSEMRRIGQQILPGASLEQITHLLETDPARSLTTTASFLDFIAARLTAAREQLASVHFDVDPRIAPLSVELAPVGSPLGAYYQPPSEDFSRPGGIRYAVGDQTVFPLYHQVSTAYHEGFPGHHLQIGTAMTRAERLSRAHRLTVWYPGYGEGWAMYTERLMGELGFFEKPDYELGMLAKQLYRAARVVVDIGLHLGLSIDRASLVAPGEPWSYERAVEFMRVYGHRTPVQAEGEVMRYLGWPGQAATYKLGEREIGRLRHEAREQAGSAFNPRGFSREGDRQRSDASGFVEGDRARLMRAFSRVPGRARRRPRGSGPRRGCWRRRPSCADRATRWVQVVREAAKSWRPRHAVGASCPRGGQVMATAPRGGCQLSREAAKSWRPRHAVGASCPRGGQVMATAPRGGVPVVREAAKSWRPRHAVGAGCPPRGQVGATAPRGGCRLSATRPSRGDRATRWVPVVRHAAKSCATAPRGGCRLSATRPSRGDRATRWVPRPLEASERRVVIEEWASDYRRTSSRPSRVIGDEDGTRLLVRAAPHGS